MMSQISLHKFADLTFRILKGTGFEIKMKLLFLRFFDNRLSKYLTFIIISCMQSLFWVIYQNYKEVWN